MRQFILSLLACLCLTAYSQTTSQADLLVEEAQKLESKQDYPTAITKLKQADELYVKTGKTQSAERATCLHILGRCYLNLERPEGLTYTQMAADMRKTILGETNIKYISSLNNTGLYYLTVAKDYPKAAEIHGKTWELCSRIQPRPEQAFMFHINLARCYIALGEMDKASAIVEEEIAISKKMYGEKSLSVARQLQQIGSLYYLSGRKDVGVTYYEQAFNIFPDDSKEYEQLLDWISSIYVELNNQPKVLEYMKLVEAHNKKELEKPCDEPDCLTERAQYFASIGNNDKARAHFLDALKKCDVNTDKEIVFKVRHNYAQFLSGIQDHASAGEYYELAADILRNNPAEQAKFALESYLGGLNYSIAAKYEASNRMLNQALSVYAQMLPDKLDKYVDASIALCRNYGFTKEYGKALEILAKAEKQLDHDHYGMKKVKERILEIVALNQWKDADKKGQIICLVGPPGVGKTSVAKSIANALGRKYARVSLGGVRDEADIRGHRKTYIGAMPGRIVNALKQAKSMNPVILFDEIDKMGTDYKGDPASAMLEVLDSEQNVAFRDHYLEIPIDLSNVLFITTANTLDTIPAPLLDRMDVIELGSYTREEKFHIAKEHLVPKQLKKHGIKPQVRFANDAIYSIIDFYTKEAGVRKLERNIAKICRMTLKKLASGEADKINIKAKDIEGYLGARKYTGETISKQDEIGAVNGLAWTSVGGTLLPLEVLVMEGTGKIELTGSLGDVMKESAKIAVSLTRSLSRKYEIDPDFYKNKDIHIHAPEGAVPKDGPSAGVTMTTALVSALSGIPVRRDVAMTGEITLRGKVLPIGGLREKTMAAYSAGIKTVVIPDENKADMKELDDVILSNMSFVLAENIDTVLNTALVKPNVTAAKKSNEKLPSAKPRASRKPGKNAVKEI